MLNRSASLAMSTRVLQALPGKLDIKRHSPSILYISEHDKDKNKQLKNLNKFYSISICRSFYEHPVQPNLAFLDFQTIVEMDKQ